MIRVFLAALFLAVAPALVDAARADAPTGYWLTEKKGIIVHLYECDGKSDRLCGRTVWLKKMNHKDGRPRIDKKNPDPALRDRHWCGMEVIQNVRAKGAGEWTSGKVYDPKTGETFDFDIEERGERLKVRGYLGVPILGKSETWTRASIDGVDTCVPTQGS